MLDGCSNTPLQEAVIAEKVPGTQEEIDKYWDNLMIEVELFNMKHKEIRLEWYMMEAFLTTQEMKEMEKRSNERNNISGSNDISVSSSA